MAPFFPTVFGFTMITMMIVAVIVDANEKFEEPNDYSPDYGGIVLFEKFLVEEKLKLFHSDNPGVSEYFSSNMTGSHQRGRNKCADDIDSVILAARKRLRWAKELIDACGKPGCGILQENVGFVGDFDECMALTTGEDFDVHYCATFFVALNIDNVTFSTTIPFHVGLCVPNSCDSMDVERLINAYAGSHPNISAMIAVKTSCRPRDMPLTLQAKVVIFICSVYVAILTVATAYDVLYTVRQYTTDCHDLHASLNECSANGDSQSNPQTGAWDRKCEVDHDTLDAQMDSVNGTYLARNAGNKGPYLTSVYHREGIMIAENIVPTVDTFFALSGILLTYRVLKDLTKEDVNPRFFVSFYLHRFWRLTPTYMFILMIYAPLFTYFGDGPFWKEDGYENKECQDYWWANLLYVNNLIKSENQCMKWTWYLATDMQFYIISPLLFLPLLYYGWRGLIVCAAFLLGTAICAGVLSSVYDLESYALQTFKVASPPNDFNDVYFIKPYARLAPFVLGTVTGFLLFKYECKARLPKWLVHVGWMTSTLMFVFMALGVWDDIKGDPLSTDVAALHNTLARIFQGYIICWTVVACANGYAEILNKYLSWKALVPLSRLAYCVYLIHPIIVLWYYYSQRRYVYMRTLQLVVAFFGISVFSYMVAILPYLAFEAPMVGLEKVFRRHLNKTKT